MYLSPMPLAATVSQLRNSHSSLTDYVNHICDRIDAVEPAVQALIPEANRRDRLIREARALEAQYPDPAQAPPLFGALVGVKDIFHVHGFLTRAGTAVPPEALQGEEATVVSQLRQAGALILGKTVTTEFAYFEPGPTCNPHNLGHTPGGSSSGSAAAVAAGFCALSLGTQTVGSVIRPAAFCGVVGFKPSYERIPTPGLLYFSPAVDHVGIFTQDMPGMQLAARVLCTGWKGEKGQVTGLPVLGVPQGPYLQQADPVALAHFERTLAQLAAAGVEIRRIPALNDIAQITQRHTHLISAEMARIHQTWFAEFSHLYRPRTAQMIRAGQQVSAQDEAAGRASRLTLRQEMEEAMQQNGIDLWVCPAAPGPAPKGILATGDPAMNLPWTHAGLPALTIPSGLDSDTQLPLGLQLAARFNADEALLGWGDRLANILKN